MAVIGSSETSNFYRTALRYMPKDRRCENSNLTLVEARKLEYILSDFMSAENSRMIEERNAKSHEYELKLWPKLDYQCEI
jgi:hypothetical protein